MPQESQTKCWKAKDGGSSESWSWLSAHDRAASGQTSGSTNVNGVDRTAMIIGKQLRAFREQKNLSQGDIEERTSLLRWYVSRVENGHTVPSIDTLEKWARALGIPLYQLFYDGDNPPMPPKRKTPKIPSWGTSNKEARLLAKFCRLLSHTDESDRGLLMHMARKMADHKSA
jgi:transcriptional regulator with XRE-family HTH domain